MSSRPDAVECPECGASAVVVISQNRMPCYVKDSEYVFDPAARVVNFGKDYGRSVEQQHQHYKDYIKDIKDRKEALRSSGKKHRGLEWIGTMPGEMADTIGMQEGDPEAVSKDPVTFLKKTGLYEGD